MWLPSNSWIHSWESHQKKDEKTKYEEPRPDLGLPGEILINRKDYPDVIQILILIFNLLIKFINK